MFLTSHVLGGKLRLTDGYLIAQIRGKKLISNKPNSRPPARIEPCALHLQPYRFVVKHIPAITNPPDYLSRHPTVVELQSHEEINAGEYMNILAYDSIPKTSCYTACKCFCYIH